MQGTGEEEGGSRRALARRLPADVVSSSRYGSLTLKARGDDERERRRREDESNFRLFLPRPRRGKLDNDDNGRATLPGRKQRRR